MFMFYSQETECDLIWTKDNCRCGKLRILRQDHPGLYQCTLNPRTCILVKDTQKRDRGDTVATGEERARIEAITSLRMPPETGRDKEQNLF